jgi:hypothetical protein
MGVCLDSGNPVWMLEDPHMTLEMLIPYAETSHVRDSAVWKVPEGIAVRWVNMGEGNVDIDGWIRKFIQAKPGLPIIFENLVRQSPNPQDLRPKILGQLASDAGLGIQSLPGAGRQGHSEACGTASGGENRRSAADRGSGTVRALHARSAATNLRTARQGTESAVQLMRLIRWCQHALSIWAAAPHRSRRRRRSASDRSGERAFASSALGWGRRRAAFHRQSGRFPPTRRRPGQRASSGRQ